MSSPATATRCVSCNRLKDPEKCTSCQDSWLVKNDANGKLLMSDTRTRTFEELAENVLKKLNSQGYCVVDKFHREEKALAILKEVQGIHSRGLFHNGQLTSSVTSDNIRGDQIAWIDGSVKDTEHISDHMKRVDLLISILNRKITHFTIQERTKAMVACYPGKGKRYVKHVDNPQQDGRCITTLYYLNKDYNVEVDGGALRLYPGAGKEYIDIEPTLDRFLIFWSDKRNPHEVLPAFSIRYAITLWYFDHNERQQEAQRHKDDRGIAKEHNTTSTTSVNDTRTDPQTE